MSDYDAGNPDHVKERKVKTKNRRELELEEIKAILAMPAGRAVLWRILAHCEPYKVVSPETAPSHAYFHNGQREVAHFLMKEIEEAVPGMYPSMQIEASKKDN